MAAQPQRILCLRSGALGDFLVLLPALAAVRASNPGSVIRLVTRPSYGELALSCGLADGFSSIDSAAWAGAFGADGFAPAHRRLLKSFDCVVNCLHDPDGVVAGHLRAAVTGRLLTIPGRVAFTPAAEHFMAPMLEAGLIKARPETFRLQFKPPPGLAGLDPSSANRRTCRFPGIHAGLTRGASPSDIEVSRSLRPPVAALHPGSGSPKKNWPADRYAALASDLEQGGEWAPLFIFGDADAAIEDEIKRIAPESRRLSNLSLIELSAVLSECAAYVGNDSGVTHLAAGLGLPVVALFGPTDPAIWKPSGCRVSVIKARPDFGDLTVERVRETIRTLAL